MARFRRNRFPPLVALAEIESGTVTVERVGALVPPLLEARRVGVRTLDGWLISADVFREVVRSALPPAHDPATLLRIIHRPAGLERAARARERLLSVALPEALTDELVQLWGALQGVATWGLRARASFTCADPTIAALASLEGELVGLRGPDALQDAVRKLWAACVYADTLQVLRAHKIRDLAVAILIEPLPPVVASGTVLTEDPAQPFHPIDPAQAPGDGRTARRVSGQVVWAAFGLGSPVIEGAAAYDLVRLSPSGELVEARIAAKTQQCVVAAQGACATAVPHAKAVGPALSQHAQEQLLDAVNKLESLGSGARKLDFLELRGGEVCVTAVERTYGTGWPEGGNATTVWSRAALSESLPGVPSPLTGSLAEMFEDGELRETLHSLGCKLPRGGALVRRVHGRYYANLSLLAPALCELPGIEAAALAGVVGSEAAQALRFQSERGSGASTLARLPVAAARLLAQQRTVADEVQRFEREAQQQRRWLAEMELAILPDDALKTTLLETYDLSQRTGRLLLTSSLLVLASHTGLKAVLARSTPVQAERLTQRITSGVGDLDSSALGVALAHVTAIAEKDAPARERLLTSPLPAHEELPAGPTRRALQQFLDAYGERAIRESELMTARFAEAPEPVLAMIAAGLADEAVDPDQRLSLARVQADRELAALEARLPYVEKTLVRALLSRSRIFIRLREHMRIWMARTLNMLRIVTLDVDRRLRRLDSSLTPGAAFFCTFEELVSAVGSYRVDLGPLIRLRRDSYARHAQRLDPPETFVGRPGPFQLPPLGSVVLHGAGCSPGVVTGRARLVGPRGVGIAAARRGEILVMRSLDVALAPLFLLAGGLVCETGGVLSHGSILAREYGLPAVAGVPSATTTVQDGERLRVDGDRGVVERLDA